MVQFHPDESGRSGGLTFHGSKGSIVRLKIKDFMTYQDVQMRAGPNVNLVVGPNGTGKSTIVCAICLALAGKPRILGRATNLKEYIRHGATTASVEVELFNPDDPSNNWVVQRVITETATQAKSDWFLNGKRSSEAHIEKLMESLNIQLDNLCQFLPQDRVQDFARMDKIQLLKSTEKSLDSSDGHRLAQKHARLEELQEKIKQTDAALKTHDEKLLIATQQNRNLEKEVNQFYDRQRMEEIIEELEGKKLWLQYQKRVAEFHDVKERYEDVKKRKEKEEKALEPLQREIRKLTTQQDKYRASLNELEVQRNRCIESLKKQLRNATEQAESEISRYNAEFCQAEKHERDRKQRLQIQKEKLAAVERELEDFRLNRDHDNNEEALLAEIREIEQQQDALNAQIFNLDALQAPDNQSMRMASSRLENVEKELQTLNQLRSSRLMYLQRRYPEVYKAVEYFFGNPANQSVFKGEIHEPLILSIFLNDYTFGKVAERCIPNHDFVGIFVEHNDDLELMLKIAQEKRLGKISVLCHSKPKNFKRPKSTLTQHMVHKYGFEKSLIDLIQVDDYYMSYLCKNISPQNIHIGSPTTDMLCEDVIKNTDLRSFYTKNKAYIIKKSYYGSHKATIITDLNEAQIFTDRINAVEVDSLLEQQQKLRSQIADLSHAIVERKVKSDALKVEREQLSTKKEAIRMRIQNKKQLENKIIRCKENIISIEAEKQDIKELEQNRDKKALLAWKKVDKAQALYTAGCEKLAETSNELDILRHQVRLLHDTIISKTNELGEAKTKVTDYANELKTLEIEMKQKGTDANLAGTKAREKTGLREPPPDVLNERVTEQQLDEDISKYNAQVGFLKKLDDKTIQDYQARKKKIEEMEKAKEEMERNLLEYRQELEANKVAYLEPLKELIEKINHNFGAFFAKIHCVGEISLDQGEDENDFAKYGVKIMVKFRTSEPLAELCGWKQSGGERAITTALYILSLQELTKVPFRVIDEINQGMDAKNERRFFDLLCSLALGNDTPQYFLLTPKMLPPVEYPDNVDFHIILNGPYVKVKDTSDWNPAAGNDQMDSDDDDSDSSELSSEEGEQ